MPGTGFLTVVSPLKYVPSLDILIISYLKPSVSFFVCMQLRMRAFGRLARVWNMRSRSH